MVQTPILASIIDAGVIFLFRWSLDDTVESVMAAAVIALNSLLVNQADEVCITVLSHEGLKVFLNIWLFKNVV